MGSLTDFFRYLETDPDDLDVLLTDIYHITIKIEHKRIRRKLKLYDNALQDNNSR